ncbi:MAG: response regulator transcription factor [Oscillospiraceae bacterium]|nr:response regulator transcription factor [Oscillospiraceae bacterium]
MKILIAEDKKDIAELVELFMRKEGFETASVGDGQAAFEWLLANQADLCIFDIMMPRLDGLALLVKVREFSSVPVLFLTAKNLEQDKVLGLDLGADDYITKPFSSLELVSRVRALLRRSGKLGANAGAERWGALTVDREKCRVSKNGEDCGLTATEYKLLLKLISSPERVFTKEQLYSAVMGDYLPGDENTVTTHISNLRDKIEDDPRAPKYIKTVRGLGYKSEKF